MKERYEKRSIAFRIFEQKQVATPNCQIGNSIVFSDFITGIKAQTILRAGQAMSYIVQGQNFQRYLVIGTPFGNVVLYEEMDDNLERLYNVKVIYPERLKHLFPDENLNATQARLITGLHSNNYPMTNIGEVLERIIKHKG